MKSLAFFGPVQYDSLFNLTGLKCDTSAFFLGARFHGEFVIESSEFSQQVSFYFVSFDTTAVFFQVHFKKRVDFSDSKWGGDVLFWDVTLPDTMEFRKVRKIAEEIDLTAVNKPENGQRCLIDVTGSDISKIRLNMNAFQLWFKDSLTFDNKSSIYEKELLTLKNDGFMDSYRALDIDYQRLKYENGGWFDKYLISNTQCLWWNYGYRKEWILLWSFAFLFLLSVANWWFFPKLYAIYPILSVGSLGQDELVGRKWIFVLQVVSYTAIIFFGLKLDISNIQRDAVWQHPIAFTYLLFIYVLGLVCLGFIANLILAR
jgi:hypothetical protein